MNVRDSEFVLGLMLKHGFAQAQVAKKADVILFNSCSVRKHAEDRLFSNIAELAPHKKKKPELVIGLMGCTAQYHKEDILKKAPLVDLVCGPGDEGNLPALIKDVLEHRCPVIATANVDTPRIEQCPEYRESHFKALVSIGEGCDNYCAYCVVPYVRGRERSRGEKDIIREVKDLADRGFKEITLLGQNVNSYGRNTQYAIRDTRYERQTTGFISLLTRLNAIKGIERIRFMTSHPKDASVELFKAMRDLEHVCEHLHLPIQAGSDRILKMMNRGYTAKHYLELIEDYRKMVPGGSVTTDIIVGFPTETEADFEETLRVVKEAGFDSAYMFKYSPRPPAKSAQLKDDVPAEVKQKRLVRLLNLQCAISKKRNEALRGKIVEVLVDDMHRKDRGVLTGRTRTNKVAVCKGGKELIGSFVKVQINDVSPHALKGRIVV